MTRHTVTEPGQTFAGYSELETKSCAVCGVLYAAPAMLFKKRWQDGESWHCPNGHSLVFTETADDKIAKLERQRNEAKDRAMRHKANYEDAENRVRAERAAKARIRNSRERERQRTAAGVCPVCNRTFKQLAAHMKGQHPDFPPEACDEH